MDPPSPSSNDDDEELFFDALDDFPFYDCILTCQSDQPTSDYQEIPSTLRRRSRFRRRSETSHSNASADESSHKIRVNLKESEINLDESSGDRVDSVRLRGGAGEEKTEQSTVTHENGDRVGDSADSHDSEDASSPSSSLLVDIAGLVIKAIGFQINLLISFILFPISVFSYSYLLITDPFGIIKRGREYLLLKVHNLWNLIYGFVSPVLYELLKGRESAWNLVLRCGWGLFWAIYVCSTLCGLLLLAIVVSGFFVRFLVEQPIQIKETLNFDYTENSPVSFVPITSCSVAFCGINCEEKELLNRGSRLIPVKHKLQVTLILTLPESDYNRKLGMFQVRVDFLSVNGTTLSSSSHPCMLKFKSEPVRLLLTFLKVAPIVTGYVSESQTLNVQLRGFVEGDVPTSCLRVKIVQRAEFKAGVGIPEIYDASLVLESELPLFKRIIWYWKKTIFVWVTMLSFMTELVFALICCRPVILPRVKLRGRHASSSNSARQN